MLIDAYRSGQITRREFHEAMSLLKQEMAVDEKKRIAKRVKDGPNLTGLKQGCRRTADDGGPHSVQIVYRQECIRQKKSSPCKAFISACSAKVAPLEDKTFDRRKFPPIFSGHIVKILDLVWPEYPVISQRESKHTTNTTLVLPQG